MVRNLQLDSSSTNTIKLTECTPSDELGSATGPVTSAWKELLGRRGVPSSA